MLRRANAEEQARAASIRVRKRFGRIYLLWLLGLAIGAVKLKFQNVSVLGASFSIDNPSVIEGFVLDFTS